MISELDQLEKALSSVYPECSGHCEEDEEDEQELSSREEILKLTLKSMRRMNLHDLADSLQISKENLSLGINYSQILCFLS